MVSHGQIPLQTESSCKSTSLPLFTTAVPLSKSGVSVGSEKVLKVDKQFIEKMKTIYKY